MKSESLKTPFLLATLVVSIIILPSLFSVLPSKSSESFSELYILGKNHMAEDYPSTVKTNETYPIFLGVGNHVGSQAHYAVYMKLRNQNEPAPSTKSGSPSPSPTIRNYTISLANDGYWETPIDLRFSGLSFSANTCTVGSLVTGNRTFSINKAVPWSSEKNGFFVQLFFELWMQNPGSSSFQFQSKYVGIWLNVTSPS